MPKKTKSESKDRCPNCGGTGLRPDPEHITLVCECPAGLARERANDSLWD